MDWYQKILEEFHKERNTAAFYKTQGFKKLWRYLVSIIDKEKFQRAIAELRKEFHIPPNGFIIVGKKWSHPPREWKLYSPDWYERDRVLNEIGKKLSVLCTDELLARDFVDVLESYLFYNKLFLTPEPNSHNLLYVTDLKTKHDSLGRGLTDNDIAVYPVALLISPYASKRDILDFIEKIYRTEIMPIQSKYKNPKSKIDRTKKGNQHVREIYKFIYEHRHLPIKEIRKLLWQKKHKLLKSKDISKILSLKKAKEV